VEETLHALSDKRVGVVTDMPRSEWEGYESRFPFLRDYPSTVVTRDDCEERKPLPNPLLLAMKKMGLVRKKIRAHEIRGVMIGDTPNDIIAGRNAGLDTAALFYSGSYSNEQRLRDSQPTYLIPSLRAVADPRELRRHQINDSLFQR
ncbi:MAG: HAD-IA family hydrolase, partial [Candidatus Aenigmarchaeota archaeon]|nr:HAD-IA family hydrolase [Candidatus Aenigmarchaeota archaeon]